MHYIFLYLAFLVPSFGGPGIFRKLAAPVIGVVLSIFALVYASGSWDYEGYRELFICAQDVACIAEKPLEPSFVLLSRIADFLFLENAGFLFVLAFYIVLSSFIKVQFLCRHAKHFAFAVFCYIAYNFFVQELTQIRASLSIAFFWLSIEQYSQKNRLRAVLYSSASIFFHFSAILGLVTYLLDRQTVSKGRLIGLVFAAFLIGAVLPNLGLGDFFGERWPGSRLAIYFAAVGDSVLDLNVLNVAVGVFFVLAFMRLIQIGGEPIPAVEVIAIKLAFVALAAWGATWWIPGIGIRTFEFLNSIFPIVASSLFFHCKKPLSKMVVIGLITILFLNLVVRNGTRTDYCGIKSQNCSEPE